MGARVLINGTWYKRAQIAQQCSEPISTHRCTGSVKVKRWTDLLAWDWKRVPDGELP
jgi:hypothetical protein